MFHVDRLKSHFSDPFERTVSPPPPVYIKGEPEYEVESIVDSKPLRDESGGVEYLIKWAGYEELSWIPWQSMVGSIDLIRKWQLERPRKQKLTPQLMTELERLSQEDEDESSGGHKNENTI